MLAKARRAPRRRAGAISAVIAIAIVVAACAPAAGPAGVTSGQAGKDGYAPAASAGAAGGEQQYRNSDGKPASYDISRPDLLIIKTGTLSIQVTGLDAAITAAGQAITSLGGYASGSQRQGDGDAAWASITYRIPASRWDEALAAIRGQAVKVLEERSGSDDVTGQVLDLGARIRNLQATESALQAIMTRATAIKDVLEVQSQLTQVREQIEQLATQKSHLEQQAALSTLTVTFSLKPDPVLTSTTKFDPATEAEQALASLVGLLQALASAGIWFAIVWLPILLVLAIVVGVVAFVMRRIRRGSPGGGGSAAIVPASGA